MERFTVYRSLISAKIAEQSAAHLGELDEKKRVAEEKRQAKAEKLKQKITQWTAVEALTKKLKFLGINR